MSDTIELRLEAGDDVIDLYEVARTGFGYQVTSGISGFGLPDVSVQWLEGAGDGAVYRSQRTLPRVIDLPIYVRGRDREHLKNLLTKLGRVLSKECTLRLVERDGSSWFIRGHHVGGGDYSYGKDTIGDSEMKTVITLRAGDPYWSSSTMEHAVLTASGGRGLLGHDTSLSQLRVSSSQAIGQIVLENPGDAPSPPVWEIIGPGRNFRAVSQSGEEFLWEGELELGEKLIIDTRRGSAVDGDGNSRYRDFAPAPRLWYIPPGVSVAIAQLEDASPGELVDGQWVGRSMVICSWRPRRRLVI